MRNGQVSRTLFMVISLILLVNVIFSIANVVEGGVMIRRVIPAVCWSIATVIWVGSDKRKNKGEE